MSFVIRLKPLSSYHYALVVQRKRSDLNSITIDKIGTFRRLGDSNYLEVNKDKLARWLFLGASFPNKRLIKFVIKGSSYGTN
jgi:ribosomal protein S16